MTLHSTATTNHVMHRVLTLVLEHVMVMNGHERQNLMRLPVNIWLT